MSSRSSKAGEGLHPTRMEELEQAPTVEELQKESKFDSNLHVKTALQHGDDLDPIVVKKLMRKVDFRLIPALGAIYAFALIDRNNLPIARLAGLDGELGLSIGNRYSLLSMMFFVPYVLCEIPSNLIIRKLGPAKWLGTIGFLWGIVTICMAFTQSWVTLLICRILFGAFEAGLFPGSIYLMSCWYTRFEVQKRFSAFYCLGLLCSGLSSLIGYGIRSMNGDRGYLAWRWIFILEGVASAVVAIPAFFFLLDFPDKAARPSFLHKKGFLTSAEVSIILARISRDRGDAVPDSYSFKKLLRCFGDWKVWEFATLVLCNNMIVYSFSLFLPLILRNGYGYSLSETYILVFPPYVLAVFWMFAVAWLGDKLRTRGPIILFNAVITITGVAMMAFLRNPHARYAGAFIGIASCTSNIPGIFSYAHNNTVGQLKRAVGTALMVGAGGCGGIISSNVFRQQDAPLYLPGLVTAIALQGVTIFIVVKSFFYFVWENRRAERGDKVLEGVIGFRYTL